jgi:hypothetical protein
LDAQRIGKPTVVICISQPLPAPLPSTCTIEAQRDEAQTELATKLEIYQAILKLKQIADSLCPALLERGLTGVVAQIQGLVVYADEDEIILLLQELYRIIGRHLFPVHVPGRLYLEEAEMHLDCIPVEPIWLEPIGESLYLHHSSLPEIDSQLYAIFVEEYGPVEEQYPGLGLVSFHGYLVAKELIEQHHGNSWKHCFGWYLLALVHQTGNWFWDECVTDEWVYEEIWVDTVWTAEMVSHFAAAFDEAKGVSRKVERFRRWVDRKPAERHKQIIAFVQAFQSEKIRNYWSNNNEPLFRTTFADDAARFPPDPYAAHPMGWW